MASVFVTEQGEFVGVFCVRGRQTVRPARVGAGQRRAYVSSRGGNGCDVMACACGLHEGERLRRADSDEAAGFLTGLGLSMEIA